MSSRTDPPVGCVEQTSYEISDEVYFFRSDKWRHGKVISAEFSTENSRKYWIQDTSNEEDYPVYIKDIRKIVS